MTQDTSDPEQYVEENKATLIRINKHSDDKFVRALALKFLTHYGDDPSVDDIKYELEQAEEGK